MKKLGFGLSFAVVPVLMFACGGTSDDDGGGTAGKPATGGTSAGGSGNAAGTSNSSSGTGNASSTAGRTSGGNASGGNASGGNASGGAYSANCPATQPEDDAMCTLPSGAGGGGPQGGLACTYGTERCTCRDRTFGGGNEGGDEGESSPTWRCRTAGGQGGFGQGGFGQGGFGQGGFGQGGFGQSGSAQGGASGGQP